VTDRLARYNLYLKADRDREIIAWLDTQKNASQAIREGLRVYLQSQSPAGAPEATEVAIDAGAIRKAIVQALDERHLNLQAIRQAVEGAVRDALAEMSITGPGPAAVDDEDEWLAGLEAMIIE
jgi:hypothetical protein